MKIFPANRAQRWREIKQFLLSGILMAAFLIVGCVSVPDRTGPDSLLSEDAAAKNAFFGPAPETAEADSDRRPSHRTSMEARWGIEIKSLRRTAAGHLLDFRFKIINPDKAALFLKREDKAYLIDQASGKKLPVPVMPNVGALRSTAVKPEANRVYFILFSNAGDLVKSGSKVSIVMGDFKAENLVVE
jgi:hypothetical protein